MLGTACESRGGTWLAFPRFPFDPRVIPYFVTLLSFDSRVILDLVTILFLIPGYGFPGNITRGSHGIASLLITRYNYPS